MAISGAPKLAGIIFLFFTGFFTGVSAAPTLDNDPEQSSVVFYWGEQRPDLFATEDRWVEAGDAGYKPAESVPGHSAWTSAIVNTEATGESPERVKEPGSFALLGLGILALLLLGRVGRRH